MLVYATEYTHAHFVFNSQKTFCCLTRKHNHLNHDSEHSSGKTHYYCLNANVFDFWFIQVFGQIDAVVSFYIKDVAKFAAKINGSNFQNFTEFSLNFLPNRPQQI